MSVNILNKTTRELEPIAGTPGLFSRTLPGIVPAAPSGTGTDKFIREDGTWANPTEIVDAEIKELTDNSANKTDLTDINIKSGTTNNTGSTIASGTFFYYQNELVKAKADIAAGATLTLNTNYEEVTAGGLNALNSALTTVNSSSCPKENTKVSSSMVNVVKNNKTVSFDGYFVVGEAIATGNKILSIPSSLYYPRSDLNLCAVSTGGGVATITIETDGEIKTASSLGVGYWSLVGSYFTS